MEKFTSTNSATEFIDYIPAEFRKNKDWLVVYYAKVPASNKLKRFRVRVPKNNSVTERNKMAKRMVLAINNKLASGWSPFYEDKSNLYKGISDSFLLFLNIIEREVKDGIKRPDTLRHYSSMLKIFEGYLKENRSELKFLVELDVYVINSFLDYVYMEKKVSPRTFNNYLQFLSTLFEFYKSKGYVKQNPAQFTKKKPLPKKKRVVLKTHDKQELKKYGKDNMAYYTLCMCTYYLFIRRTELTKIKVSEVSLVNRCITILAENSKNKKTESVTIPKAFYPLLTEHLKKAKNDDYLFSKNNFKPGSEQMSPKKISDTWVKFRKLHKIKKEIQFYSLKDTGITDLLNSGVPSIKVRDQARHHDLKMTEAYTSRNETSDAVVQSVDFSF